MLSMSALVFAAPAESAACCATFDAGYSSFELSHQAVRFTMLPTKALELRPKLLKFFSGDLIETITER